MENSHLYPHSCKFCRYCVYIDVSRQAFCRFRGVVDAGGMCKKYAFDPFKYKVKRVRTLTLNKFKKEDFDIE